MSGTLTAAEQATRDLILVLADSKRLLGMRYAEWILGAPELEAGIACASMAQDEWGHGRLLYSLLKDFGDDTDQIEHGREAADYRSIEVLDSAPRDWLELIAVNALVDAALSVQLEALRESSHQPLRQRVGKMLDEEVFHAQHGVAWFKRLAQGDGGAESRLQAAAAQALHGALRWFGPDAGRGMELLGAGVVTASPNALRERYLERGAPLLSAARVTPPERVDFSNFDEVTRRTRGSAPDADTIKHIRGDKNRIYLMD